MAIKQTITNENWFWEWLTAGKDSTYYKYFSYKAAKALHYYYDQLSDDLGQDIEFDPIAWCCEWAEYDSLDELAQDYPEASPGEYTKDEQLEWLRDRTQVIELDNGHVLIQEF